jgi:WD repeat-containing protein 35
MFAVCGCITEGNEKRAVVQFYSNLGNHLKTLRVANAEFVTTVSFEGGGLRLVLGVQASLYFANLKLDYKWAYLHLA